MWFGWSDKVNGMGGAYGMDGGQEGCVQSLVGKAEGKKDLEDRAIHGMIIVKWTLKKLDRRAWIGLMWLNIGSRGGLL
jgi:hypothetical protein